MFDKLIGNENVKATLGRFIGNGRVPNSLIFSGIDGIGKKQFAVQLVKSLLCKSPVDGEGCDECSSCLRVDVVQFPRSDDKEAHKKVIFSEHPDFGLVIPYNRNVLIDAIRSLDTEAHFRPFEAGARVFIIDDADKMNDAASNALLKTLEEPAATSYIFLITSRADSLLPTIRSRCQMLRFEPVSTAEIERFLERSNKFLPEDVPLISRIADGSIGRAMSTDAEKFRQVRERMLEVVENGLIDHDHAALLRNAEVICDAKHKSDYEDHINVLKGLLHDIWRIKSGSSDESVVNADIIARLRAAAEQTTSANLIRLIEEIEELQLNLIVNINRKVATDSLFVDIAASAGSTV